MNNKIMYNMNNKIMYNMNNKIMNSKFLKKTKIKKKMIKKVYKLLNN